MKANSVEAAKMLFSIDRDEHILRGLNGLGQRKLGKVLEDSLTYFARAMYTAGAIDATTKIVRDSNQDESNGVELTDDAKHFSKAIISIAIEFAEDAKRRAHK